MLLLYDIILIKVSILKRTDELLERRVLRVHYLNTEAPLENYKDLFRSKYVMILNKKSMLAKLRK